MVCVCWFFCAFFGPPYPTESCLLLSLMCSSGIFLPPSLPRGPLWLLNGLLHHKFHSSLSTWMFVCPFCPFIWPQSLLLHGMSQPGRFKLKRGYLYMQEVMSLVMYFGLQSLELYISVPKMELKRRDDFHIRWKSFAEGWVRPFQKKKFNFLLPALFS